MLFPPRMAARRNGLLRMFGTLSMMHAFYRRAGDLSSANPDFSGRIWTPLSFPIQVDNGQMGVVSIVNAIAG